MEQLVRQIAAQQADMKRELENISLVLQELAAQKKDIEHLREHQADHRSWLKNHEERVQAMEKKHEACNIGELKKDVKALRQTPGDKALQFLYAVLLLGVGSVVTLLAAGGVR